MNKKLTLNVDESLIDFAHEYSKKTHQSISNIVEKYFLNLKREIDTSKISSSAKEIYGILESNQVPDKDEMRKEFHEKSIN